MWCWLPRPALNPEVAQHSCGTPADTVRAAGALMNDLRTALEAVAAIRIHALAALRAEGASYDRIANLTGLSKSRVAQLAGPAVAVSRGSDRQTTRAVYKAAGVRRA